MQFKCEDTAKSIVMMRKYIDLLESCVFNQRDLLESCYPLPKHHKRKLTIAVESYRSVLDFAEKAEAENA